ncbi:hypothetical protein Mapa_006120 [Marchantia paleacea]|nr:hypothetical protein Mapa_006120 [Marchantia paleacea]
MQIAHIGPLLLRASLDPVVPLAPLSLPVLCCQSKRKVHTGNQGDHQISHHNTVAQKIMRCILGPINVRTHDTLQIPPRDHHGHDNTSFVRALHIVRDPGYGICNGRVNPHSGEVHARVPHPWSSGWDNIHYIPHDGNKHTGDGEFAPLSSLISCQSDSHSYDERNRIRRHGEKLRMRRGVTELSDDRRKKKSQSIRGPNQPHVNYHRHRSLPISDSCPQAAHVEGLKVPGRQLRVRLQPCDGAVALIRGQEFRRVRKIRDNPERNHARDDGNQALGDENPSPSC